MGNDVESSALCARELSEPLDEGSGNEASVISRNELAVYCCSSLLMS